MERQQRVTASASGGPAAEAPAAQAASDALDTAMVDALLSGDAWLPKGGGELDAGGGPARVLGLAGKDGSPPADSYWDDVSLCDLLPLPRRRAAPPHTGGLTLLAYTPAAARGARDRRERRRRRIMAVRRPRVRSCRAPRAARARSRTPSGALTPMPPSQTRGGRH